MYLNENTHLFTSFIVYDDCPESVKVFYTRKIIPQWAKIHKKFFKSINIITNIPNYFEIKNDLKLHPISLKTAFCGYSYKNLNVTASQLGAWIYFINYIKENDVAVYLDPDAFMINNRLNTVANRVLNCELTKIVSLGCVCDAGVAVLRNTSTTRKILSDMTEILCNTDIVNHIEIYYHNRFKGQRDYFIKWSGHSLLLRGQICGVSDIPDTIHGHSKIDLSSIILDNDSKELLNMIEEKDKLRVNYLPER